MNVYLGRENITLAGRTNRIGCLEELKGKDKVIEFFFSVSSRNKPTLTHIIETFIDPRSEIHSDQ